MSHRTLQAILLSLSMAAAACAPRVTVQTPPGFAVLEDQQEYVYRATSADGVVIGVRAEDNKPSGNLDFWADVLDRTLRRGGYVQEAEGAVMPLRSRAGFAGREMRYLRDDSGHKYRFWVAVFVTEKKVWVVEAGGDHERFKGRIQEAIQKAIESVVFG
jgi:hypothetical protein